jgi:serine/threonine protein kinase
MAQDSPRGDQKVSQEIDLKTTASVNMQANTDYSTPASMPHCVPNHAGHTSVGLILKGPCPTVVLTVSRLDPTMPCNIASCALSGQVVMAGQLYGHYRILEKIGAGAMGDIFRARDERLGRDVALKLIRGGASNNPDHLRRFEQEARAAAALNHPNIVAIYDVGFEGTTPYIVSELLVGKNLRERLMEGAIPLRDAVAYGVQIANGLSAAHDRHIVHRDLKPENLFLTNDGRIKILDFGVAKLLLPTEDAQNAPTATKHGAMIGTVAYMSPEQLRTKPVDHRSDVFSLGAILYEMLTRCRAFGAENDADTITAVLREEPPESNLDDAKIPAGYRDVVRHCLEKDPGHRFQSAKDLAFALETLSGKSGGTIPLSRRKSNAKLLLPWAFAGLLALATALLLIERRIPTVRPEYQRLTYEAGTVFAGRFAPDGSVLYSAAWNGDGLQLFTTVGNSPQIQPLNPPDATLLAVSKANELALAMHGTHNGQLEPDHSMLADAPLAGGSPREIMADVPWADWDHDGKQLAIVHFANGRSVLEYPIGTVLYQTTGRISDIRFSPQGDKIAFMDHPADWDGRGSVCVTDLSGHVQTLSGPWASERGLAWRPDGKEIWFSAVDRGNNLNLMAVTLSRKLRMVLNTPEGITLQDIAADGRVLATVNSRRLEMALSVRGVTNDSVLSWHDWNVIKDISRDNQFVVFEDSSEAAGSKYAVARRKLDGSLPTRLGDGSAGGLSPDGKWAVSIDPDSSAKVTLLPIGPGQPRAVDAGGLERIQNGWAHFTSDGKNLLVNGNEPGHAKRCYLLSLGGGKARAVTTDGVDCGPISPDDRFLATDGPNSSTVLYPLDGGSPRPLPQTGTAFVAVQWSTDGSSLYGYHLGELPAKIYALNIATGKETELQELRPGAPAGVVKIAPVVVSRDGTHFAYSYSVVLSSLYIIKNLQ